MSKLNQVLLGTVFSCLAAWYTFFVWQLNLKAIDLEVSTKEDSFVELALAAKGMGDGPISFKIIDRPSHGIIEINQDKYFYIPNSNYNGSDYLTYIVSTKTNSSKKAEIRITVSKVNDPPTAKDLSVVLIEDRPTDIYLSGQDVDSDELGLQILELPKHGKLSGSVPKLTYNPNKDYSGQDQFTYFAYDEELKSKPGSVKINVVPINDPPVPKTASIQAFENNATHFELSSIDPDSEELHYTIVQQPKHGKLSIQNEKAVYSPKKDYIGLDTFTYRVKDDFSESEPMKVDVSVSKINKEVDLDNVLNAVVQSGGIAIGDSLNPEHIVHNGKYIPASVLKIVTAATALHYLGANYRFKTEFYIDKKRNLYIKGFGDPTLSSANWHTIARTLRKMGYSKQDFNSLVMDSSVFSKQLNVDGRRRTTHYYDAPPSVLATNQNTVAVRIKKDRQINVVNEYTPLTALVAKKARRLPVGFQHFNVAVDSNESLTHSAELAQAIFKEYGVFFSGNYKQGTVPKNAKRIYVFHSNQSLKFVVKKMLKESNNFTANQLLLVLAYELKGEGVSISTGAGIITGFLKNEIGLDKNDFALVEGSGLSTKNSFELRAMLKIINYFNDYKELLPHLRSSKYADLAKAGRRWNIVAKSGTLKNIETLAGFIQVHKREWKPFVIMLRNEEQKRGTIMEIIAKYYNS